MKSKITLLLLTIFLFVSNIYSQTDRDPDKLGGPVLIGEVPPFTLPNNAKTKKLKSGSATLKTIGTLGLPATSIKWPDPGTVKIEKTASATTTLGKWKINVMVQGKNIQTNTDVVLVIDNSGSMRGTKMNSVIEAANTFVDELLNGSTGIQIAVVVINKPNGVNNISGTPFVIENFTDDTASLHTSINNIIANGGTNIQGGFYAARTLLEASSADKKVTILLSDGDPTYSYKSTVNTPSPIPTYNCSTKTWSPSAATVLNNLSIASSIYTTVDGDGANYGLSLYSIQSQNCASNNPKIVTLSVGNNGIPTMYEAGLLMNGPAKSDVYTIGFEVSAGGNAENTLTGS